MDFQQAVLRSGGVVGYRELLGIMTRHEIEQALGEGRLSRVRRGYYGLPLVDDHRRTAQELSGVLAGLSAAMHWGWKVKMPPERPHVIVPLKRRVSQGRRASVALRWADLGPHEVKGEVLAPVATVLDCARRLPVDEAVSVVDSALRDGVSKSSLLLAANRLPRTGRSRAVRAVELGDRRAANPFESVLRCALMDLDCVSVEPQQWVGNVGRADLVDQDRRLVVEADSHEFHSSPEALLRDMERYNGFVCEGYLVLRFGWNHAMFEQDYVRATVSAALAAHRQEVRP